MNNIIVGKRRLNNVEIVLTETAKHILKQAEDLQDKNQIKYLEQVKSASEEIHKRFLFSEKRRGCRLMNALREAITNWSYNEGTTPREIAAIIPSNPTSISMSLEGIIKHSPETGLRKVQGEYGHSPDYLFAKVKTFAQKKTSPIPEKEDFLKDYGFEKIVYRSWESEIINELVGEELIDSRLPLEYSLQKPKIIHKDRTKVDNLEMLAIEIVTQEVRKGIFFAGKDYSTQGYRQPWSDNIFLKNLNMIISEVIKDGLGLEVVKHKGKSIALYDPYYLGKCIK